MLESERVLTIVAFILIIMAISLHYAGTSVLTKWQLEGTFGTTA